MDRASQLRAFIEAAKQQGATDEFLVALLKEKGWPTKDVYSVLADRYVQQSGIAAPEPPGRLESAREAFFHLLAFATLAVWIFSIGSIWFELIQVWLPDAIADRLQGFDVRRISRQMASIIVAFPAFVWATRSILRDQAENPDKAESAIRRWLSNIALLITTLVFLGDLIAFTTLLLQGELTARFAMRCLVVLILAGAVFLYYSRGLGKSRILPPVTWHRVFAGCAAAVIVVTIGLGFRSTGSPADLRIRSEDQRRVRDLYDLTVEISNRRQYGGLREPPTNLAEITAVAVDPFTGLPYEYRKLDGQRYQLCAVFQAASPPLTGFERFWTHPAGRHCFEIRFNAGAPFPPPHFR